MWDAIYNAIVLTIVSHQAGFNMMPQMAYRQAIEAWSGSKITKPLD